MNTSTPSEIKLRKPRGQGHEAKRVEQRLQGFNRETSPAWIAITARFSSGIVHHELRSVAQIIAKKLDLKVDRDASRDNRVLIKWFDENWEVVEPELKKINLIDEENIPITAERENLNLGIQ